MKIISASINLSKIPKDKITVSKSGDKWLNIDILIQDSEDRYGYDTAIIVRQTKEERETKIPRTFIGNGKTVYSSEPKQSAAFERKSFTDEKKSSGLFDSKQSKHDYDDFGDLTF